MTALSFHVVVQSILKFNIARILASLLQELVSAMWKLVGEK
jgi:hypothetical protein